MINRDELEDVLSRVAKLGDSQKVHVQLVVFMLRSLARIRHLLPGIGLQSLQMAERYWLQKVGSPEDLENARVACWDYLENTGASVGSETKEQAAMRAVICVLYAEPDADDFSVDTVRWFADLMDRI
ncbi:hypothetical protein [Comamonas sp. MYb396]|uniref:hypothetical protein n=1 Tax=Comamonas sp. MYb396 TaxID=2745302 RepID=UPI0030B78113